MFQLMQNLYVQAWEKKKFHEDTKKHLRADLVTFVSKEIKTWLKGRCRNIVVKEATFDHIDTDVIKRFGKTEYAYVWKKYSASQALNVAHMLLSQ